jgi:DNA-binding NarL/FixJ family response regulator
VTGSTQRTRVLVADDHPVFRKGLCATLSGVAGVDVVGAVADGAAAVTAARELRPDVVLMDLSMPEMDGRTACQIIHNEMPDIAVLVLTMSDDPDSIDAALRAGARGYLLKGADEDTIARALATVSIGDLHLSHAAAEHVLARMTGRDVPARKQFAQLSAREAEVLDLVAQGKGNAVISRELYLSNKTVRNHVSNILTKIGAQDRSEAVQMARARGLGQPDT